MKLTRIQTLEELLPLITALLEEKRAHDDWFEPGSSESTFVSLLSKNLVDNSRYYGELVDGKISYFFAIIGGAPEATFWLLYVSKPTRAYTRELLDLLRPDMAKLGVTKLYSITNRFEPSYERWLRKFGAKKSRITFEIPL